MLADKDIQMFARLSRNEPRLRAWLETELAKQNDVLIHAVNEVALRRAQGCAGMLAAFIRTMEQCGDQSSG